MKRILKVTNLCFSNISIILFINFVTSCLTPPEQKDLDTVFDVVIIAYEADTGNKLTNADVILKTDSYRTGKTNSDGRIKFSKVQQHGHKLHLYISKSVSNPEKYYVFDSVNNGYPGGIDFYSLTNHTFTVNVSNILY